MRTSRLFPLAVCSLGLLLAACGNDAPVANAERGGQGAGTADNTVQDSATAILQQANTPGNQDTTGAGANTVNGTLRGSLNHGEATRIKQPEPPRPGTGKVPGNAVSK
jgi:hypothetical protein